MNALHICTHQPKELCSASWFQAGFSATYLPPCPFFVVTSTVCIQCLTWTDRGLGIHQLVLQFKVQPALHLLSRHILHWCTSSVSSVRVISHHQNSRILRLSPALSELLATTIVLMNSRRTMALGTWFTDRLALGPCAFAYTSHCASWPCAPGAVTCDFISTTQIQLLVLREYLLSVLPDD